MSQQYEEFEVGQQLDQSTRMVLVGVAQLVERLARSSAEQDRRAAQVLREQVLEQRAAGASRPDIPQPALDLTSRPDPTMDVHVVRAPLPESVRQWAVEMEKIAANPGDVAAIAAADRLRQRMREEHRVDVVSLVHDARSNTAEARTQRQAAEAAERESVIVVPAYRQNPDRGVSPSKASTPEEATHRRQAWAQARERWELESDGPQGDPAGAQAAWDALPMDEKTKRYWSEYDTESARTVRRDSKSDDAGRGMSPAKAGTAEERLRRQEAWDRARAGFTRDLGPAISAAAAEQAWKDLDWPEKAVRYWREYDKPVAQAATDLSSRDKASTPNPTRERVLELNEMAAEYFSAQMTEGSKGRQYLETRLGSDTVDHGPWRLGYAPPGWTNLTDHLRSRGATDEEIIGAGLGRVSSRGNVIDAFRDRAMVGVRSANGELVGFVGRDLSGESEAKYINTGRTIAYTKGEHLLGLHEAPDDARLVRVEGPLDAVAISAAGEGRVAGVAPLGTALTEVQADLLAERSGRVWGALDADKAGQKATEADFWLLHDRGVDLRTMILPGGSDPAQLWQDEPELLRSIVDVADAAPSAATAVVDNAVDELGPRLATGELEAHQEFAALRDRLASSLEHPQDRLQTELWATSALERLSPGGTATHGTAAAAKGETRRGSPSQPPHAVHDRAGRVGPDVESEGRTARIDSAPGFPGSTRDVLADAQRRGSGDAARTGTEIDPRLLRGRNRNR
jgi:DNA primase catalytic core